MRNYYWIFGCVMLLLSSCSEEKKVENEPFNMYETSELATMMEEMYVFNDSLKQQILKGEELSKMPFDLQQLHSLEMTDRFDRDENFNQFAQVFEKYQTELFTTSKDSLTYVYNNTINTCVACHQTSCTGPIPRIKKLLID